MSNIEHQEPKMTEQLFFSVLLAGKLIGHIKHLEQHGEGSFAAHLALEEYYKGANKIADKVIETFQGYQDRLITYDSTGLLLGWDMEAKQYLELVRVMIEDHRYEIIPKEQTHLHNELDNYVTLIDQITYKLSFLK
jgi:hypothetical protein